MSPQRLQEGLEALGNRAPSAVVWVDSVLVWEYTGSQRDGVQGLSSLCRIWVLWESDTHSTLSGRG